LKICKKKIRQNEETRKKICGFPQKETNETKLRFFTDLKIACIVGFYKKFRQFFGLILII